MTISQVLKAAGFDPLDKEDDSVKLYSRRAERRGDTVAVGPGESWVHSVSTGFSQSAVGRGEGLHDLARYLKLRGYLRR